MSTTIRTHTPLEVCAPTAPAVSGGGQGLAEETPRKAHSPLLERIRARAYEIFRARDGKQGDAASDWLQAERELNGACGCAPCGSAMCGAKAAKAEADRAVRGETLMRSCKE